MWLILLGMVLGGIALGLSVSGLWNVRVYEENARTSSLDNLRRIGTAIHIFQEAYGRLPPAIGGTPMLGAGIVADHPQGLDGTYTPSFLITYMNVHGLLLPFVEQEPIYNRMRVAGSIGGPL